MQNTRSAIANTEGSDRVVMPNGPLGYWVSKLSTSFLLAKGIVDLDRLDGMSVLSCHGNLRKEDLLACNK